MLDDIIQNNKVLIVIPTWKRSQAIKKLLAEESDFLEELKISICIYDSSPDDNTFEIVNHYKTIYNNILYEKVDEAIPSNEKYFDICRIIENSEYEYLWIIQDHLVFVREAGLYLLERLKSGADFYYLDMFSDVYTYKQEHDLNEFSVKSAWMLTRFGTAILRTDSILKGVDWCKVKEKWLQSTTINNSHVGFFFDRLAEMAEPKIESISFERDRFYDFMRYQPVAWNDELLRICLECWGSTIEKLPDIYNKNDIMQSQDSLFVSNMKLLMMKTKRKYGIREYLKYRKWIKNIYPYRYRQFRNIAVLPRKLAETKYLGNILKAISDAKQCNWKIYIFGAGRHASELSDYLDAKRIEFDGFVVSRMNGNPDMIGSHYVYEAKIRLEHHCSLVILAVAKNSIESVKNMISEINYKEIRLLSATEDL